MVVATTRKTIRKTAVDFLAREQKAKDWTYRRIIIFVSLAVCTIWITWAAGWMRVETATSMLANGFNLMMMVIGSYVFGAIVDDHLRRKATGVSQIDTQSDVDPDHHHRDDDSEDGRDDNRSPRDPDKNKVNVNVKVDTTDDDADDKVNKDIQTGPYRGDK